MISTKIQTTVALENHRAGNGGDVTASIDTEEPDRRHRPGDGAEDFPEAVVDGVAHAIGKPRARGWIHVYAAVVAFIAGATLVSVSWAMVGTRAGLATLLYTLTIVAMFAVSGTYHRVNWKSATRAQVDEARRPLDDLRVHRGQLHAVRTAGAAVGPRAWCCSGSSGAARWRGVLLKMFWPSAPRWVGRAAVPPAGLGGGVVRRADHARRRRRGPGAADRRRRALQHRRRALRA